jgi:hypothetical protein
MKEATMETQVKISEESSINVGVLSAVLAGLFAVFLVVAGAIFWGGLLQAQAGANAKDIVELKADAKEYRADMERVKASLLRLEIRAGTLPPEGR